MNLKLSKQINLFEKQRDSILKHFNKVGYSKMSVTDYCAITGIPLYIVYYFLWKNEIPQAKEEMIRLATYYKVDIDI